MKKRTWIIVLAVVMVIVTGVWLWWGNSALQMHHINIANKKIPTSFQGYRIVHLSDLHNAQFGDDNEKLLSMISKENPDMIAISGDLIDSRKTNVSIALDFLEKAQKIAPCYYVNGNHEAASSEYESLKKKMKALGITVLEDEKTILKKGKESITLMGLQDPAFTSDYLFTDTKETALENLMSDKKSEDYTILLSHRPELFLKYADAQVDLVLSGHAHGGQIRLPFLGGIVAPNQGLFPKYDGGVYTHEKTTMIVSRGLGNSILPLRINNRPEIIVIDLQTK